MTARMTALWWMLFMRWTTLQRSGCSSTCGYHGAAQVTLLQSTRLCMCVYWRAQPYRRPSCGIIHSARPHMHCPDNVCLHR